MAGTRLTQRRVDALPKRRTVRDVRDTELKGYGVRVMPSGAKRYFIHSQHQGRRVWKIVGDAGTMTEAEARARARSMLAALRDGRNADAGAPGEAPFETVAEEVFTRYGHRWKPRTLQVNRIYLRRQILPFFEGRPIGAITARDVQDWFRSLHATQAAANRSAPILSVIMQQAEAWGYRPENSNPCRGIRRYRQTRSERFLSPEEYHRLARVLDRHEADRPLSRGGCPPASPDRMPQVGDPYPRMAFLPGRKDLSARQQDGPAHGLAVRCSAGCPGPSAAVVPMGLPGRRLAHPVELAGSLLVACEERSRPGGSPSA